MQCLFGGVLGHARKQQSLEEEVRWLQQMLGRERRSRLATAEESAALEQEILSAAQAARDMGESLYSLFFNPCYIDQEVLQEPSSQLLQEHAQTAWQHGLQQHARGDQVVPAHKEALQRPAQQQQQQQQQRPTQQPTQLADGVLSPGRADTGPTVTHDQAPQQAVPAAPLLSSSSWTQGLGGIRPHTQHPPPRSSSRRSPRRLARSSCSSPPKTAACALSSLAPAGISAANNDVAQAGAAEQAPSDQGQTQHSSGGEGSSTGESPAVLAPFGSVLSAEPVNHGQGARCCSSSSSDETANSWARRPGLRLLPETIAPAAVSGAAAAAEAARSAAEGLPMDAGSHRAWHTPAAGRLDEAPAAGRAAMQAPRVQGSTRISGSQPGADSRRQPGSATERFDSATRFGTASPAAQEGPLAKARPHRYAAAPTARQQHLHSQPGRVRVGSSSHHNVAPPTASSVAAAQLPHRHDAALVQRLADGRAQGTPSSGCLSPLRLHRGNLGSSRASFQLMVLGAGAGQDPSAVLLQQLAAFEQPESLAAAGSDHPSKAARLAAAGRRKRWLLQLF